jgi:membrane associated rhomboid family serine protease
MSSYLLTFFFSLFRVGVKQIAKILVLLPIIVSTLASLVASFKQCAHLGGCIVSRVLFLDNLEEGS